MNSLKEKYTKEIIPELEKKHNYTTVMAVPKLEKIVVNMELAMQLQTANF